MGERELLIRQQLETSPVLITTKSVQPKKALVSFLEGVSGREVGFITLNISAQGGSPNFIELTKQLD